MVSDSYLHGKVNVEVDWVPEKVYDEEGDFAGVRS